MALRSRQTTLRKRDNTVRKAILNLTKNSRVTVAQDQRYSSASRGAMVGCNLQAKFSCPYSRRTGSGCGCSRSARMAKVIDAGRRKPSSKSALLPHACEVAYAQLRLS